MFKGAVIMGKRILCQGIIAGAVIGGIVALFNKDARGYVVEKMKSTSNCAKQCIQNPTEAIGGVRKAVDSFNQRIASTTVGAINALEQVEKTIGKVVDKK